jgi:hypothetical protein
MPFYTTKTRDANRTDRTDFARQATINAFGWRFAKALDQADFVDRRPGEMPRPLAAVR